MAIPLIFASPRKLGTDKAANWIEPKKNTQRYWQKSRKHGKQRNAKGDDTEKERRNKTERPKD